MAIKDDLQLSSQYAGPTKPILDYIAELESRIEELASGDKIGIEVIGTTVKIYYDTGSGWTELDSYTDAGVIKETDQLLQFINSSSVRLDEFGGGTAIVEITSTHPVREETLRKNIFDEQENKDGRLT